MLLNKGTSALCVAVEAGYDAADRWLGGIAVLLEADPPSEHRNAFGFLRLLLASLVIAAHVPELADGNSGREILSILFGTISFGVVAVDGFFLISGYLIVKSFVQRPAVGPFLLKRIARIYPGFLLASFVSVLVVAPLGGASWQAVRQVALASVRKALTLQPPLVNAAFVGTHFPVVNGALWTIPFEARCYLLVVVLGLAGALRRPWLVASFAAASLLAYELAPARQFFHRFDALPLAGTWLGRADEVLRLTGIFLAGSLFYLWRDRIRFTRLGAVFAAAGLITSLCFARLAEPGIATFGAYLLFSFARWGNSGIISQINNRDDISYGVYLYAWPIEKLLLWYWPTMPLSMLGSLTLSAAIACGYASWFGLEKPVMERLRPSHKLDRRPKSLPSAR